VADAGRSSVTPSTSLSARHAVGADGRPNWVGRLLGQYDHDEEDDEVEDDLDDEDDFDD